MMPELSLSLFFLSYYDISCVVITWRIKCHEGTYRDMEYIFGLCIMALLAGFSGVLVMGKETYQFNQDVIGHGKNRGCCCVILEEIEEEIRGSIDG